MVRTIFFVNGNQPDRALLNMPVKVDGFAQPLGRVVEVEHIEGQTKVYVEWVVEVATYTGRN